MHYEKVNKAQIWWLKKTNETN